MSLFVLRAALLATTLATTGPAYAQRDSVPSERQLESVHQPVVSRTDYVLDLAAGYDGLAEGETARLDAWFGSLELGYGDAVYVEESSPGGGRQSVANIAGQYGVMIATGAPVTAGRMPEASVRVVLSRTTAEVPGCPNWSRRSDTDFANRASSNYGCAVNGNLAAMIADPNDLIRGRSAGPGGDGRTLAKTVETYRKIQPSGSSGELKTESAGGK